LLTSTLLCFLSWPLSFPRRLGFFICLHSSILQDMVFLLLLPGSSQNAHPPFRWSPSVTGCLLSSHQYLLDF
jgi:hypothetical protein